jgi:hypothetical protein
MAREDFDDYGTVEISKEEYGNLLMARDAADYVYGIIAWVANEPDDVELIDTRSFARNLLDEWTK